MKSQTVKLILSKVSALFLMLFFTIGLIANCDVAPTRLEATQFVGEFDPYTYSGAYYDTIDFDAAGGMNGALRQSLTSLIKPEKFYTYGSAGETHLATQLQYADEDPTNSQNMIYLYTRDSVQKNAASSWNREHVWPQSLSNGNWGTTEGGTDILHLRPTYSSTNSSRGNTPYGESDKITVKRYNGMLYGYTGNGYFEPIDSVKGDVARIIMYLWTTYTGYSDYAPLNILKVFESYDTLLRWHTSDKPDVLEGNRNDYAQTSRQKNRNPFVDHPELAWRIFGDNASLSVKNACMEAYPSTSGGDQIVPTGIRLNKTTINIEMGKKLQLSATLEPLGATGTVYWSSNNSDVASVNNTGLVTANAVGSATITATVGDYSASCSVNVTEAASDYGTLENPLSITDAVEIISKTGSSETAQPLFVKGIVSSNTAFNTTYHNYDSVWLQSDDGRTAQSFRLFRCVLDPDIEGDFSGADSLKNYEIVAYGYGKIYNATYELTTSSKTPSNPIIKTIETPEATGITLSSDSEEMRVGETITLTATLSPSNSTTPYIWESSDENVATVENGTITGVSPGTVIITASVSGDITAECIVVVIGNELISEYIKIASYDFSSGNSSTSEYDAAGLLGRFNTSVVSGAGLSNIVDSVNELYKVYAGYANYYNFGLKLGTSGESGSFVLNLNDEVSRVVINTSGWTATDYISVGDADSQTPGVAYSGANPVKALTFDIASSDNVEFTYTKRGFIQSIDFFKSYSGSVDNPGNYLSSAQTITSLYGTEAVGTKNTEDSMVFADSGMSNGEDIQNVSIGSVTLNGDIGSNNSNSPKYYTSGHNMRVYSGNTFTFDCETNITRISFTLSPNYDMENVSVSEGILENNVWTGETDSITFTNNGSSQVRFARIDVTYDKEATIVNSVYIKFSAKVSVDTWTTIKDSFGPIEEYGIMMFKSKSLVSDYLTTDTPVQDRYEASKKLTKFSDETGIAPSPDGDYHIFSANVTYSDNSKYDAVICAAAYFVVDGNYYFFGEKQYSVNSLAHDYRTNGGSSLSDAALEYLETTHS